MIFLYDSLESMMEQLLCLIFVPYYNHCQKFIFTISTISMICRGKAATLIIPEHEFIIRFLGADQSFLKSDLAFVVALILLITVIL